MKRGFKLFCNYELTLIGYLALLSITRLALGKEFQFFPILVFFAVITALFPVLYVLYIFLKRRIK
jgi:hypothetical protein